MNSKLQNKNALAWLWRVTAKCKIAVIVLMALQMILGICSVISALLLRDLIDQAAYGERAGFFRAVGVIGLMFFFQMAVGAFNRFMLEWTQATLENRLKERLFSCLLHKDYAAVSTVHSGDWIARLTSDTREVTGAITGIFPGLAGMAVRLAGAMAALFYLEPLFFYLMIPAGIIFFLVTSVLRGALKRLHKKIQEANGVVISFLQERLENLMILRVFAMEEEACAEVSEKMRRHKTARLKRNYFFNLCNSGFILLIDGSFVLATIYCGYGILQGRISYGTFMAVTRLLGQVQGPFVDLSGLVPQYYAMLASAERLMEAEKFADDGDGLPVPRDEAARFYREEFQSIGVRNASFSYETAPGEEDGTSVVIDRLDLEIRKGEYVAFTGHSGCGKSTLLKLFMCLYPLDKGERYLRTDRGEEIALTSAWRSLFAYVPQGNQLMSGSIREIVAFGQPEAMKEEKRLEKALKIACADEFVSELEQGIDTMLGERGSGLSEGQMQRIAIARALFSDRPVLILDEATSSLDEATERRLLENLRQMTDKTVLIITHRPAALEICDREISMSGETCEY